MTAIRNECCNVADTGNIVGAWVNVGIAPQQDGHVGDLKFSRVLKNLYIGVVCVQHNSQLAE